MGNNGSSKKRVCIIGAGPSGLIAVREFTKNTEVFDVVCMEKLAVVGGLWNYSEVITDPNHPTGSDYTALYKNLRTNTSKQVLAFSDLSFPEETPSFIHHSDLKNYLWNYAKTYKLHKFIKFNTKVTSVKPKRQLGREDAWQVESVDVNNKKTSTAEFDIVIVCNGCYVVPYMPVIKGVKAFKGKVIHSQHYREPENFKNKKVLLIGGASSGVDIAMDINKHAKKVWLSHKSEDKISIPESIEQVREVVEFVKKEVVVKKWMKYELTEEASQGGKVNSSMKGMKKEAMKEYGASEKVDAVNGHGNSEKNGDEAVKREISENGNGDKKEGSMDEASKTNGVEELEAKREENSGKTGTLDEMADDTLMRLEDVDVVIFCTGYSYSFPFLNADCGVSVVCKGVVAPLYKDLICIGKQTLSFIGINTYGTNLLFECQAKFLRRFYEETFKIPRYGKEILEIGKKDEEEKKLHHVDVLYNPHRVPFFQWQYMRELASIADFEPIHDRFEKVFNDTWEQRVLAQDKYQDINFELGPDGYFVEKKEDERVEGDGEKKEEDKKEEEKKGEGKKE